MGSIGTGKNAISENDNQAYNNENTTIPGRQKMNEVLSDLSIRTHPNDVKYVINQIDDPRVTNEIDSIQKVRRNSDGYILQGGQGVSYENLSNTEKQKIIDLIKRNFRGR